MSFAAAQLIYTNVEKRLSPTGREGFQVWLRTPDVLNEPEETEIQNRLGDFEERREGTSDEPLARHLYFALPSGRVVIARSAPEVLSAGEPSYPHSRRVLSAGA